MRKTIHKWFWLWDFEKEEKWLNEMSAKGLQLTGVGFCRYTFEKGTPNKYNYRLDFLKDGSLTSLENETYIHFLEETGVEHIGTVMRWAYLRKEAPDGQFELYSDLDSKIAYLKRIFYYMLIFLPMILINTVNNLFLYYCNDGLKVNLVSGWMCFAILLLYLYGMSIFYIRVNKLKKEKLFRE